MATDENVTVGSGGAGKGLFTANSDLALFMASVRNGGYPAPPGADDSAGLTAPPSVGLGPASVLAAAASGASSDDLRFVLSKFSQEDLSKLSEQDWAAVMTGIVDGLRASLSTGEAVACSGCEFFASLQ